MPPPNPGLATVTFAVPKVPMSIDEIAACNCVLEMNAVVRALPFHCTMEAGTKFVPTIDSVKDPPPAMAELGFKLAMLGGGDMTVKVTPLLATPPTVTTTFPVLAPVGTGAVILVALQLVAVAAAPLNARMLLPCMAPKFVPVTVTPASAIPEVGLRLVIVGELLPLPAAGLNAARPAPHLTDVLSDAVAEALPAADWL